MRRFLSRQVPPRLPAAVSLGALLGVLLGALALAPAPAAAQGAAPDSMQVARYQLAESYFRAGQFDRAVPLLEDLAAAAPDNYAFYDKLKQAYESLKRYDEAIALVDLWIERSPVPVLLADRARLLYLRGDEEAAFETWQEAVGLDPANANTYRNVYRSLLDLRLFERAIAVLEAGRERLGEDGTFLMDLAYLYGLTGQHERMMGEYLQLLSMNERQLGIVRSRLARILEQEDALRSSIAVTERAVRRAPLNRAYRELLAWLYIEAEQYRLALDVTRAIDRLEQENGLVLFTFAQIASDAAAYDVALEAYEEILQRYPESPIAPQAQFGLGEMYQVRAERSGERAFDARGNRVESPDYDRALAAYRTFLQKYPSNPSYPEVLREIGYLQQDVFFDLGAAEATLEEVVNRYPATDAAAYAAFDLGRLMLLRGDLDEARVRFARLEEELRLGELAERARYELALLHFYRGEFESAYTLAQVLNTNTSTDVANDAIELKVLLVENKGPDSLNTPLRTYAEARLLERQRRSDAALDRLDALLREHANHPLVDDVRFLRAEILRDLGRTEEALAIFLELPLLHPQSFLADRSLFEAAVLQEDVLGRPEAALETFTRLLTEYPGSLLAGEARARIRRLRGDGA